MPDLSVNVVITFQVIQGFLGAVACAIKMMFPVARLRSVLFLFCLSCNAARYFLDHLFQNDFEMYCARVDLFLAY